MEDDTNRSADRRLSDILLGVASGQGNDQESSFDTGKLSFRIFTFICIIKYIKNYKEQKNRRKEIVVQDQNHEEEMINHQIVIADEEVIAEVEVVDLAANVTDVEEGILYIIN